MKFNQITLSFGFLSVLMNVYAEYACDIEGFGTIKRTSHVYCLGNLGQESVGEKRCGGATWNKTESFKASTTKPSCVKGCLSCLYTAIHMGASSARCEISKKLGKCSIGYHVNLQNTTGLVSHNQTNSSLSHNSTSASNHHNSTSTHHNSTSTPTHNLTTIPDSVHNNTSALTHNGTTSPDGYTSPPKKNN